MPCIPSSHLWLSSLFRRHCFWYLFSSNLRNEWLFRLRISSWFGL